MSGQQPKQGIGYEVRVAASLKTRPEGSDGAFLDLTSHEFVINPNSVNSNLTELGIDVTIDLLARLDNLAFYIECKSSTISGEVLRLRSNAFLDSLLEFVALQSFSEKSGWSQRYLLVTNYPYSPDVSEIFRNRSDHTLEQLCERLRKWGKDKYPDKFQPSKLTPDILNRTLSLTSLLVLTDQYLAHRLETEPTYKKYYEIYASQIRLADSQTHIGSLLLDPSGHKRLIFCCKGNSHDNCYNTVIDGLLLHIGDAKSLIKMIAMTRERSKDFYTLINMASNPEIPFNIEIPSGMSNLDISSRLTEVLNEILAQEGFQSYSLVVMPGTYDIVVVESKRLADAAIDTHTADGKYDLDRMVELNDLGKIAKVQLSIIALRKQYGLVTTEDNFSASDTD